MADDPGAPFFNDTPKYVVSAMLADSLIDELHLFVYPGALGTGPKLLPEGSRRRHCISPETKLRQWRVHLTYSTSAV